MMIEPSIDKLLDKTDNNRYILCTLIANASRYNNIDNSNILQYIIETKKVRKGLIDGNIEKLLKIACSSGNFSMLEYLCEINGKDKQLDSRISTDLLQIACEHGSLPIVKYLCEKQNANVNTTKEYKNQKSGRKGASYFKNLFYIACENGYTDIARYLYRIQNVNIYSSIFVGYDRMERLDPTQIALKNGHHDTVEFLKLLEEERKEKLRLTDIRRDNKLGLVNETSSCSQKHQDKSITLEENFINALNSFVLGHDKNKSSKMLESTEGSFMELEEFEFDKDKSSKMLESTEGSFMELKETDKKQSSEILEAVQGSIMELKESEKKSGPSTDPLPGANLFYKD